MKMYDGNEFVNVRPWDRTVMLETVETSKERYWKERAQWWERSSWEALTILVIVIIIWVSGLCKFMATLQEVT